MKRKILIYSLSVALLASIFQATPTFASPITQEQINKTKGKITETQEQIEDIETKIQQLDDRIIIGMEKSKQLNDEIKVQQGQIVETKAEIIRAKKDLETNKTYYSARLKTMQEQGQQPMITYAEFILSSESLSQVLTRSTAIMQILDSNTDVMNTLAKKEASLTSAEQKLEEELAQLKKNQDDLATEQKKVEADKVEINKLLAESKNNLKQQQTQLATEQALKSAQDKAREEAQERARQEAQEKARQEAQERAQQAAQERAQQEAQERAQREAQEKTGPEPQSRSQQQAPKSTSPSTSPSQKAPKSSANKPAATVSTNDGSSNSDNADKMIAYAKQFLGVKYVWGGTTPNGFDCSGFTQYVFRSIGISLPRVSRDQQDVGTSISPYNVKKGDLVFRGNPAHHVGIYIGGGKYIHAPQTGDVVKISAYNPAKFTTAARVLH
jgi:cell wall-associated NlpC family hydrolase